jgi:SepF-like predicted cell division protein (DUF552 family)
MSGIFRRTKPQEEEPELDYLPDFIDLAKYSGKKGPSKGRAMVEIKFAEIDSFEDVRDLANYVYEGHILILDFTPIANDELTLKRIINELKRLVADVGGDIAGIAQNLLLVTPKSIGIDRHKIRKMGGQRRAGFY